MSVIFTHNKYSNVKLLILSEFFFGLDIAKLVLTVLRSRFVLHSNQCIKEGIEMFTRTLRYSSLAMMCSIALVSGNAQSAAVIVNGETLLGVNNEGHLNYRPTSDEIDALLAGGYIDGGLLNSDIGLYRDGVGDATSPGCLCEGWGIAINMGGMDYSAGASVDNGSGITNLTGGTFGSTLQTATSEVMLSDIDVSVTHAYGPSLAAGVFQAQVSITNNTGMDIDNLIYRRAMDWDIPPTEFNEYVTHQGVEANLTTNGGNVLYASDNGFADVDPLVGASFINSNTVNVDFVDDGPDDHGSVFDFQFGSLVDGGSRIFNIFYGSTANENEAITAINTLGIDVYSLGQQFGDPVDGTPATFLFGFGGVGGVEPGATPDVPILPFVTAPGEFSFTSPEPGRWYDPPFAEGFIYTLLGGAMFSEIETPDSSFGFGDVEIYVGGSLVATVGEGMRFDLSTLMTDTFELFFTGGILLDIAEPDFATAFPLFLDWTGTGTELRMSSIISSTTGPTTPVNAPASVLILLIGAGFMLVRRRTH